MYENQKMDYICSNMRKLVTLLGIAALSTTMHAAQDTYTFRHYTSRNGLSSNTVSSIIQDCRDLIWIGTSDGLDSFDGRDFIHHTIPGEQSVSVQSLFEDSALTIWVGTEDAVYRYSDDTLSRVEGISGAVVSAFAETRDGSIWIGTQGQGVYRFREDSINHYNDGGFIEALHVSSDNRLWAADMSKSGGILIYNAATDSFTDPGLNYIDCAPTRVCAVDEDANGNLWLGTWDKGVYRIDRDALTVKVGIPAGPGLGHIHSLTHSGALQFFVGSDDGLLSADLVSGEKVLLKSERSFPGSLSNKYVYPVLFDREGGLWVGTYYGGVNYASPNVGRILSVSMSQEVKAQEDYIASCFCEDPDGSIWVGSDNGGLFHYYPSTGKLLRHNLPKTYNIHALLRDGDYLWIGTYSDNLLRLDTKNGSLNSFGFEDGLESSSVYALAKDVHGTLWVGTTSGICRLDASGRFILERSTEWINEIRTLPDGSILVAQARGNMLMRSPEGTWTDSGTSVNCISAPPSSVYAGTRNGLVVFSESSPKYLLGGMNIQGIVYDGTQLWLTTQGQIMRYSPQNGELETYGDNDGVHAALFSQNALFTASDGRIYAGTADGFISFHPGTIKPGTVPPRVIITRINASGQGVFADLLKIAHTGGKTLLKWNFKDLYASFAAPVFSAPEKVIYSYKLEGLDNEWKSIGNQNSISLSQLPAGRHYKLRVRAGNYNGTWSPEEDSFEFSIIQHPLQTNLAIAFYVLAILGIAVFVVRKIIGRIEKRSKMQYEQRLDEAVSLVKEEEKDERAQFIGSITDQLEAPMAGIGIQLEKLKGQQKELSAAVKTDLAALENSHRMLRSVTVYLRQMQNSLSASAEKEDAKAPLTPEDNFLARLDKVIVDNISNPELSVNFLAKEMAISRSSLFAKVNELTGETPNKLINLTRLNMAANLLTEGKHSVSEICYMVGFSSPSYFSKIFVTQFGLSPLEWSKRNRE